ncbi:PREDICTED: uncharacterized protein LOC109207802 [Nicotiana attenuata]|uniref:uncharacterized protein LOC109207802 n=1 Tax=Nicotiana attenuata TaxID=49451 RepID=UPI000904F132|nr:PREDICTED: uncharacterized protein LOC109207802 [Nicotiana attenuata]
MGAWRSGGDTSNIWTLTSNCIREAGRAVLGDKKGFSWGHKGDWLAKVRESKDRDLDQERCIKDEDGTVLVEEACIRRRWQAYIHKLLNDDGDRDIMIIELENSENQRDFRFFRRITVEEVEEVMRKMSKGRATGPDKIPVELWKAVGWVGLEWLTRLFNVIFRTKKMPEEWRWSFMVLFYMDKGDIQNCNNYRRIKLPSHTMKVWERVVERRVRKSVSILEN